MSTPSLNRLRELDQRLAELGLNPADLVERFSRASGPGGQHVNRTATRVQLQHQPSGLETTAEGERSQLRNRIAAREQLIAKVEALQAKARAEAIDRAERERRRKRRPSPSARRRTVKAKRKRGEVKQLRGRVAED